MAWIVETLISTGKDHKRYMVIVIQVYCEAEDMKGGKGVCRGGEE